MYRLDERTIISRRKPWTVQTVADYKPHCYNIRLHTGVRAWYQAPPNFSINLVEYMKHYKWTAVDADGILDPKGVRFFTEMVDGKRRFVFIGR